MIYSVKIKDDFVFYYDICHVFNFYLRLYFSKTSTNNRSPSTEIRLAFQKEFAFFNSINSKETSRNLSADIPKMRPIATEEIAIVFEINAVEAVSKINKP
jgi:hypothetical protein